jgi:hypothetical protein
LTISKRQSVCAISRINFFDALGWHEDIETAVQPLGSRNQRNIRMTLKHSLSLTTLILRLLCLAACPT